MLVINEAIITIPRKLTFTWLVLIKKPTNSPVLINKHMKMLVDRHMTYITSTTHIKRVLQLSRQAGLYNYQINKSID